MKTLVVAPNWIGDALMAQPLLSLIRGQGAAPLDVMAPAALEALFRAMPEVDDVITTPFRHGKLDWRQRRALAARLRAARYARCYVLPNSLKAALIPLFARIPERIGYVGEMRHALLTRTLANPGRGMAMVERYARLAEGATLEWRAPRLVISDAAIDSSLSRLGLTRTRALYALCPGAEYGPAKRWPARHFAALADLMHRNEPETELVLIGASADQALARDIVALSKAPLIDLTGKTSLADALAIIAASAGVVSNDSGLMHVAAAFSRAQVAVFGSSDPRHTPPNSGRAQVVWLHLECSPCFERVCPLGHLNCLNGIPPEQVYDALVHSQADKAA